MLTYDNIYVSTSEQLRGGGGAVTNVIRRVVLSAPALVERKLA